MTMEKVLNKVEMNFKGKPAPLAGMKAAVPGPSAAGGPKGAKRGSGSGLSGENGFGAGSGLWSKPSDEVSLFRKRSVPRRKAKNYISVVPVTIVNARPKRGFTMVEILMAIGLLTISLAVATPYVQKQAINTNLKTAVRAVESDIFDLKQRAITENIPFAIVFDPTGNTYTIQQNGVTAEVKTPTVFGADIQITSAPFSGGTTLAIQTGGTTSSGSITFTNSRGSTATISINIAGRTYVQHNML